ncbi:sensor histidine kinase [Sediminibacterium goheungense]|uniref:Histidine kinase n=1 Tax=Sediminibacterium goheungense TaxID=1086393 RepID=A0A4R6J381_9BACT|nr:histidine kinase [Sediminibacterium goheungense]TDO29241.1 histidine kinase [Sediminibacterium goheungense]
MMTFYDQEMLTANKKNMKRIRYFSAWSFALIFTILYSSLIFSLFATIHPEGTPSTWASFFFYVAAGLATFSSIYFCYRLIRKRESAMSIGWFYGLLFVMSLLLFPFVYGLYYGVIVNRMIYSGGATISFILNESRIMVGVFHVPICFSIIVGLYNEKVFRLNQDIIEKENMLSETRLVQLQQQVDPHFLFNNLNILSALIQSSPAQAEIFSQRLSELYRYHLRSGKQPLVTLLDELQYMQDYFFLLSSRFGDAFRLDLQEVEPCTKEKLYIVTGTLQLLLENVVKHNAVSLYQPLIIRVKISNEMLVMENEIRFREAISEGVGLKNLEHRYKILSGKTIIYESIEGSFRVQVPLIKQLKLDEA